MDVDHRNRKSTTAARALPAAVFRAVKKPRSCFCSFLLVMLA
jgi:hypothetical protein